MPYKSNHSKKRPKEFIVHVNIVPKDKNSENFDQIKEN